MAAYQSDYDGQYYDDPEQEARRRRGEPDPADDGMAAPAASGPSIYQGTGNPRDFDEVHYGDGTVGKKTANGWQYDWRTDPYQDVLSDSDVASQRKLTAFRAQGGKVAEDDATALQQMNGGLASAYGNYLGQPTQAPAQASPGGEQLSGLLDYLKTQQTQKDQQQQALRDLIMSRVAEAGKPVDPTAPGIKEMIAAQRLAHQRAAERSQSQNAARLANMNLGSSGEADTSFNALQQQRGEADAQGEAQILGNEHQAKRDELRSLLSMAVASGDAESARTLQAQIAAIDSQLAQERFGSDLNFRQNSFVDDLGARLLALQLGANQSAAGAFL